MAQYVDTKTAYGGQVRKVVLMHLVPGDAPERWLVSIDVLEHVVRDRGVIRGRLGPRVTRKIVLEPMGDDEARAAAEAIGREHGTSYICIVRDGWLWPTAGGGAAQHDAAD